MSVYYESCLSSKAFFQDVKPLPDIFAKALLTAFQRYNAYLDAFQPDETFIRKKVENELGTRMIHLKMRCGGLGSEWGKVLYLNILSCFSCSLVNCITSENPLVLSFKCTRQPVEGCF